MRIWAMVLGGVTALVVAGCGGSSHNSAATTHAATTHAAITAPTTSPAPEPAITRCLLTVSEYPPHFTGAGPPSVSTSVQQLLTQDQTPPPQMSSETARYKKLGFVAAASQQLNGPGGGGVSYVEQFRSPPERARNSPIRWPSLTGDPEAG